MSAINDLFSGGGVDRDDRHGASGPRGRADVVSVAVPVALERTYSYRVPHGVTVAPGAIVAVPLGPRKVVGVVWDDTADEALKLGDNRLREIDTVYDAPPIDATLRRFVDWVASYYLMPRGMVLRMVLRAPEALSPEPPIRGVRLAGPAPERLTAARQRVLDRLGDGFAWSRGGLAASVGVSGSVIDGLIAAGTLEEVLLEPGRLKDEPDPDHAPMALNEDQEAAAAMIRSAIAGEPQVFLVDGVTGSGKTEVYFEAAAAAFAKGRQVLILLPEIALTNQFIERFQRRFGVRPGEWHSDVTPKNRARLWRGLATGEVKAVVGARSALYLPFRDLGLVVVDEEHDGAFKQAEGVNYHARDMAVLRGRLAQATVVLASATPSLESRVNADQGRYRRIILPNRVGEARLPDIEIVDMRRQAPPRGRFIAPPIVEAVRSALGRGEQGLLFLNRRGYAPLTVCRTCGHRAECPNCSTWLVEHRFRNALVCHQCGHSERRPDHCPGCGEVDSLVACGPGVERVAEEAAALFPDARRLVLSSDMPGGTRRLKLELEAVANGEVDLVIGTQLVAKGHNFPKMTVVGVVDADLGLSHGDPRAAEKTFQLLLQVTGRAGRAGGAARGILQTHVPEHPTMRAIARADAEAFYAHEIAERRLVGMPPFGRLAALVVSAETRDAAHDFARRLALAAPQDSGADILGPAEAPIAVIRGRHRFRFLVRAPRSFDLQRLIINWVKTVKPTGGADLRVDIDPQSFL